MIDLAEVGATPSRVAGGWQVAFGIYLPGITPPRGYRVKVRVIHELDQFVRGVEPGDFDLAWQPGSAYDRWAATVAVPPPAGTHFGQDGRYLYRFQLLRGDRDVTFWFADPFGRATGVGTLSAFSLDPAAQPFAWTDVGFRVPEVDDLVVYELHVGEFNLTFDGVAAQLDYLRGLGVNALELMPVTNVKEEVEWGYTPLGFFAPDDRYGGADGLRRLVDACHARGVAVLVDAVYAHAHPEFAYNLVYDTSGEPNPMMGRFAGEFFSRPGTDYRAAFTREYFLAVNRYWLDEYHIDGFRYDYVPGMYDGPAGVGYADLVYRTYQVSRGIPRFQGPGGRSLILQCAEHLPDPAGILSRTYSNTCWQNGLLDRARDMARWRYVGKELAHLLDPEFLGYPAEYANPATGERFPVAPFQYLESHDHGRFVNEFGRVAETDLVGEPYGDRELVYKTQPYAIALYTAKGVPMLWQGQEFGENWGVPAWGLGRNLFGRPVHWEYFYDRHGKALVRLYRVLGELRRRLRSLRSRGYFFYYHDQAHLDRGVIAFRREAPPAPPAGPEVVIVLLNFTDQDAEVWVPFPKAGRWVEQIDLAAGAGDVVQTGSDGQSAPVTVKSNYGAIYLHQGP